MTFSSKTRPTAGKRARSEHVPALSRMSIWSTLLVDPAYRVLECSRQAAELLGVEAAKLGGVAIEHLLAPASYTRFTALAAEAAQQSQSVYDILHFAIGAAPGDLEVELYAVRNHDLVLRLYAMSRAERRAQILVRLNRQASELLAAGSAQDVQQHVAGALHGLDMGFTILPLSSDGMRLLTMPATAQPRDHRAAIQALAGIVPGEASIPVDSPLFGDVVRQRVTLYMADTTALVSNLEPRHVADALDAAGERIGRMGVIASPLVINEQVRGVLSTWGPGLSSDDIPVVEALSHQVSGALQYIELRHAMEQQIQKLASLATTSRAISQLGSPEDVLRVICEQAQLLLGAEHAAVACVSTSDDMLAVVMTCGVEAAGQQLVPFQADDSLLEIMQRPCGMVVDDVRRRPDLQQIARQLPAARSLALYGLRNQAQVLGVLVIGHSTPRVFTASDLELMERYADLASVALANAEAHRSLKQSAALQERQYVEAVETRNYATMVIENVPDALVICDHAMIMHPLNERPLRAVGFARSDLEGRPFTDIVAIPYQSQISELWRQVQEAQLQRFETMLLRADGTSFHAWITAVRIPNSSDVLTIVTDITARHKLMQAEKMAALGRLVSGVAHELNNPLAVVLGLTQLQLMEDHPPFVRADLQGIEGAVLRASAIVQQLRMFIHPSAPLARAVNLATLIEEAICEHHQRLDDLGVELQVTIADDLPLIEGDQALLRQAFINILDNALASIERMMQSPEPREQAITIDVWQEPIAIAISISDTGTGIAPEHLSYIFEPFFTTLGVGQGLGLGLAIVYTIVQQHGGHIWAEHTSMYGVTFQLRLPYTQSGTPSSEPPLFR